MTAPDFASIIENGSGAAPGIKIVTFNAAKRLQLSDWIPAGHLSDLQRARFVQRDRVFEVSASGLAVQRLGLCVASCRHASLRGLQRFDWGQHPSRGLQNNLLSC